jgi:hypothetical protein
VVVHLTMEDVRSDEKQNNPKHDSQVPGDSFVMNHESSWYGWMSSSISDQQTNGS